MTRYRLLCWWHRFAWRWLRAVGAKSKGCAICQWDGRCSPQEDDEFYTNDRKGTVQIHKGKITSYILVDPPSENDPRWEPITMLCDRTPFYQRASRASITFYDFHGEVDVEMVAMKQTPGWIAIKHNNHIGFCQARDIIIL